MLRSACTDCGAATCDGSRCPACDAATGAADLDATTGPIPPPPRGIDWPHVPGYTLLAELGRGGMGVVYKARDERLKRTVALKMVLAGARAGRMELARFQLEAEAVARLHHPNVVQIYEVGQHHGLPYLALEYVEGGTLKQLGGPQPVPAAARLVEALARAVHAAHERGIVHRDLKPANVLLASPIRARSVSDGSAEPVAYAPGSDIMPKITDFGVAKRLDRDAGVTRQGELVGTPAYMAPEQAQGRNADVGPAADTYALGAILYELLTGRPPFVADSWGEVIYQVISDAPTPPRKLRKGLSRELDAVCLKCLEKDPKRRYPSALDLAEDLRRYREREPTRARAAGLVGRAWNWVLRNPVPASLLLTVTLLLAFGLWHLRNLSHDLIRDRAEKDAREQTRMLNETMACYSASVVAQARAAGLEPRHDFKGPEGGIPFPVAFTMELSEQFKKDAEIATKVRIYSDYRFRFRGPAGTGHLDEWEKETLKDLRRDPSTPRKAYTVVDGKPALRYATPLLMKPGCVDCHRNHPESQKRDLQVGEVRGVLQIIRPLTADVEETDRRLAGTYRMMAGMAAALLTLSGVVLAVGRRRRA